MKRTMVYLPDELHENLKRLAVEQDSSLASLVREAVEALCREDMEDIAYAKDFLKSYKPGSGQDYEAYKTSRLRKR
jgi:predicted DNA-binding protein